MPPLSSLHRHYPASSLLWACPTPCRTSLIPHLFDLFSDIPALCRKPDRVSQVPTRTIRYATMCHCLRPRKSAVSLTCNETLHAAFQLIHTLGLHNESISGLTTFTYVAARYLPATGFISFVTSTDAAWVTGCWLHFTRVGLEPTGSRQLSLAHKLPDPITIPKTFG